MVIRLGVMISLVEQMAVGLAVVRSNLDQMGFRGVLLIGVVLGKLGEDGGFFFAGARTFFVTNFFQIKINYSLIFPIE